MPLILGLSVEMFALLSLLVAIALLKTEQLWLRPLVEALQHPHGSWIKRRVFRAASFLARGVLYVEHRVASALSQFAYFNLHLLVRFLNGLATLAHHAFAELEHIAEDTAHALDVLVHHTIPRLVHAITHPIDVRARAALRLAYRGIDDARALDRRLSRGIDRLHARVDADAARFARGIDRLARENIGTRLRGLEHATAGLLTRDLPALWRRERALERKVNGELSARLGRIEKALGLGLAGAVVYKVLARVAPWLFCRNVKVAGRALCGMNPNTLNALLAAALATVAIEDLRTLTRYAQEIESKVTQDVKRLLSV